MAIIGYAIFLFVTHVALMQIFRKTTYHESFWAWLPALVAYSAFAGWALFALDLHQFFLWHVLLASLWLFWVSRNMNKQTSHIYALAGDDANLIRDAAISSSRTKSLFARSSFIYVVVFAVTYLYLYNS